MPLTVPLRSDLPYFDLQATLDGVTYTLVFRWNVRLAAWFLTVLDADASNVLVGDTALRVNFPLSAYMSTRRPPGQFVVIDSSGQGLDPIAISLQRSFTTDLGTRCKLVYFTVDELGIVVVE